MVKEPEVCVAGLGLLESPRWASGAVWFSDWTAGNIHRFDVASRADEVVAHVDSMPLCFDVAGEDLIVLDSRRGVVLRGRAGGDLHDWVDVSGLSDGAGNEVLALGDRVYLNFGNFDIRQGFPTTPVGRLGVVDPGVGARVLAEGIAFPNGMAVTADGEEIVVAESHASRLTSWRVAQDGSLTDRRTWADLVDAAPDGISMSPDGTCWYADVPARQAVRVAEGGEVLDRVQLDRGAFSCAVAPEIDRLFITAAHWPGGQRMFDPAHEWDGTLFAVPLT